MPDNAKQQGVVWWCRKESGWCRVRAGWAWLLNWRCLATLSLTWCR
jgi:hypothetical protein